MRAKPAERSERSTAWRICCGVALALAAISFTPLVIPAGRETPRLANLPYTLWVGFAISLAFLVLTFVGARLHPDSRRPGETRSGPQGE